MCSGLAPSARIGVRIFIFPASYPPFQVECWGLSIDLEGNKEGGEGGGFLLASIETKNVGTNSKGKVYAEQLQPEMD